MKLNNPITQEPWAEQFDLENQMQEWVTDPQSEKEIKAFISKWLKQEREKGILEMIELVRQWAEDHDNQIEDEAWKMLESVLGRKIFKFEEHKQT